MTSTLEQPLLYFENIAETTPQELFKKFVNSCKKDAEYYNYTIISEDFESGIITTNDSYLDFDTDKVYHESFINFNSSFKLELEKELTNSKNLINEYIVQNPDSLKNYILLLEKVLQFIINKGIIVNQKYPIFFKVINQIKDYLNEKYLFDQDFKIELSFTEYNGISAKLREDKPFLEFSAGKENEVINAIFSFMSGKNEKQEKIMSDEQYSLMIKLIVELVEKENLPNNIEKLEPVSISNDLLSFAFWVLHKQLYTTKKIRPYFLQFLKQTFSNFDNKEISSIKKGFGTKSRALKDDYLPEIISQYL